MPEGERRSTREREKKREGGRGVREESSSPRRKGKEWATRVTITDDLALRIPMFPLIFFERFSSTFLLRDHEALSLPAESTLE